MEHEPGYTPLAHQEECDCCCGCDSFAERDDYLISRPFPAVSRVLRGLREKALERTAGSLNNSRVRGRSR
jgi:hypothetical protein